MPIQAFSEEWAQRWREVLSTRPAYQEAARTWEGSVAVVMTRNGSAAEKRAIFLDLWHGHCREARVARDDDLESARFVLSGSGAAWRDVLTGRLAPLMAVMSGKIRLTRGSMAALVPYAAAARELLAAAMEMEIEFPSGW